ncbi:MAG: M10 family metallopeptidase [Pseudomonadota bacterium]
MSFFASMSTQAATATAQIWQPDAPQWAPFTPSGTATHLESALGGMTLMNSDDLGVVAHPGGCGCMGCGLGDNPHPVADPDPSGPPQVSAAPLVSLQTMANYLREGYWDDVNWYSFQWNMTDTGANANDGVILYNLSGYDFSGPQTSWINRADTNGITDPERRDLIRESFKLFEEVLGIDFEETTSSDLNTVDMFFSDNGSGANASTYINTATGNASYSFINVNESWWGGNSGYNSYTLQTIHHEIGHALGLGHQGTYNGSGRYRDDAVFANDSWQASMMSYFSQTENTAVTADYEFLQTPQSVDWIALNDIYRNQSHDGVDYGVGNAFLGDTVYGFNTNISSSVSDIWANYASNAAVTASTIVDAGGIDTLNLNGMNASQRIDLTPTTTTMEQATTSDIGGRTGNLTLAVGTIIENVVTGGGNDSLMGNRVANMLDAGNGGDTAWGRGGSDLIYGRGGNDRLYGQNEHDTIWGGDGNDTIEGGLGRDVLNGESGADLILGGTGDDFITSASGNATLDGGDGNDTIRGGSGSEDIVGGEGNDRIWGFDGNDTVLGGDGDDNLRGGNGVDSIRGGDGDDVMRGEGGDDFLIGESGSDVIYGGNGFDFIKGGGWGDTLYGGNGRDRLVGESGDDRLFGEAGFDTLFGGGGEDVLEGGGWDDELTGGAGNDRLDGGTEDDILFGESGADTLIGGAGNDTLDAGSGDDVATGGSGEDLFVIGATAGSLTVTDFSLIDDTLDLTAFSLGSASLDGFASAGSGSVQLQFSGSPDVTLTGLTLSDVGSIDYLA